ncbi:apolipoprotein N-acyltransferase [Pontibacter burrus]|uniref:Apolipoprotein N-acyltransferase n=1 Tax=Pontibacter burrus TaxID=2704466 RepID=A0A6B3LQH1_9BACT|nr:apolipoprotein N-acyltransferase [Pontibacter burrus]NEM99039.1 apolipoprotein N-acyltransferase [Pontibacter burrus]
MHIWKTILAHLRKSSASYSYALVVVSAILISLSLMYVNYTIAWFALSFLFLSFFNITQSKQALYKGFVFGVVSAGILNYWMVAAIYQYAQSSIVLGIICWLLAATIIGSIYALQFFIYSRVKFSDSAVLHAWGNAFLFASVWVIVEWLRAVLFAGMPWMSYSIGITQASHLFLAQPAAVGGVYILSFLVVLVNFTLSYAFHKKAWRLALIPALIVSAHFIAGSLLYNYSSQQVVAQSKPKVSVALILASMSPETVWNEQNGNALIQNLLTLNRQAAAVNSDLILWSETVIPWTYSNEDDFLKEVAKTTADNNTHFLLGMSTSIAEASNAVYNSAYLFTPTGAVLDRYDKGELLSLVESPLFSNSGNIILPFLAGSGLIVQQGQRQQAMKTPWGKAGVLLCNESAVPALLNRYPTDQISFLINLGNDGWFSDSFITRQHFYNSRLRAIESRKDLVINNNRGISGVIRANGEIGAQYQSDQSSVQQVDVFPNQVAALNYHYFIYAIFLATALLLLISFYNKSLIFSLFQTRVLRS